MVSTLSTLGFDTGPEAEFVKLAEKLAATVQVTPGNPYAVWRAKSGVELWFHVTADGSEIVGFTPYFKGESRVPVRIATRYPRAGDSTHEGLLVGELTPAAGLPGLHPLVLEAVDFVDTASRPLPFSGHAQIVGFAHQLKAFASAEDYEAQQLAEPKFAARSFVPLGLFGMQDDAGETAAPSTTALVVGEVMRHRHVTNEETGQQFHWLLVEGLEAAYDIVAESDAVEGDLAAGRTVEVTCNLVSRLID